jgi:hypothetical protein
LTEQLGRPAISVLPRDVEDSHVFRGQFADSAARHRQSAGWHADCTPRPARFTNSLPHKPKMESAMTAFSATESKWDRFNPIHDVPANDDHYDEYGAYLPTPGQIEDACLRIQAE